MIVIDNGGDLTQGIERFVTALRTLHP
jgi:hypothetical protein